MKSIRLPFTYKLDKEEKFDVYSHAKYDMGKR